MKAAAAFLRLKLDSGTAVSLAAGSPTAARRVPCSSTEIRTLGSLGRRLLGRGGVSSRNL